MKLYIIEANSRRDDDETLFWSNEDGWVDYQSATRFTEEERHTLNLPINGRWLLDDAATYGAE